MHYAASGRRTIAVFLNVSESIRVACGRPWATAETNVGKLVCGHSEMCCLDESQQLAWESLPWKQQEYGCARVSE